MSSTIYSGKTRNGVIIQDMVDDNRDYVYRNNNFKGYFARFAQSLLDENDVDFKTGGPAIAIFNDKDPFKPIWGVRLPSPWEAYDDELGRTTSQFLDELTALWEDFGRNYHKN